MAMLLYGLKGRNAASSKFIVLQKEIAEKSEVACGAGEPVRASAG
jgi:hypothetical protein